VHRIGRTGRAGAGGAAISLVSSDESGFLRDIERVLRRSIPVVATPEFKIVAAAQIPDTRPARPPQGQGRSGGGGGFHRGAARGSSHGSGGNGAERRDFHRSSGGGSRQSGQQRGRSH
jgi:ATP-dependent RNA helicase RhlE